MSIDWFTFTAQIINFLVLVWLLKRFLYGPIVRAMDKREKTIAERLQQAEAARAAAEREAEEYRRKTKELEHAREQLLAEAGREIADWKRKHLAEARQEIDQTRDEWYRALQREREAFLRDLRRRVGREIFRTTRHILENLCDVSLEERILEAFLKRLREIRQTNGKEIASAIRNARHQVLVKTGFEPSEALRQRLQDAVHEVLGADMAVEFVTAPEIICGVELQAGGFKVAWSAGESLQSLEEEMEHVLEEAPAT